MDDEQASTLSWLPLSGRWRIDAEHSELDYQPPMQTVERDDPVISLALTNQSLKEGEITVDTILAPAQQVPAGGAPLPPPAQPQELHFLTAARIVLGYDASSNQYLSVGIGGGASVAFLVSSFGQGTWTNLASAGTWRTVEADRTYKLRVNFVGQRVKLWVDGILVIDQPISPLVGTQVGLLASGPHLVRFCNFKSSGRRPTGFVVMQFGDPFDGLYEEVIRPVALEEGVELRRADDISGPGPILSDIVRDITDASVIVAEITPANPNVFYELGYAQALGKPTILLAQRGQKLPFDVAGMRTIFYDDTIAGKRSVESDLRRHLRSIFGTGA